MMAHPLKNNGFYTDIEHGSKRYRWTGTLVTADSSPSFAQVVLLNYFYGE